MNAFFFLSLWHLSKCAPTLALKCPKHIKIFKIISKRFGDIFNGAAVLTACLTIKQFQIMFFPQTKYIKRIQQNQKSLLLLSWKMTALTSALAYCTLQLVKVCMSVSKTNIATCKDTVYSTYLELSMYYILYLWKSVKIK